MLLYEESFRGIFLSDIIKQVDISCSMSSKPNPSFIANSLRKRNIYFDDATSDGGMGILCLFLNKDNFSKAFSLLTKELNFLKISKRDTKQILVLWPPVTAVEIEREKKYMHSGYVYYLEKARDVRNRLKKEFVDTISFKDQSRERVQKELEEAFRKCCSKLKEIFNAD